MVNSAVKDHLRSVHSHPFRLMEDDLVKVIVEKNDDEKEMLITPDHNEEEKPEMATNDTMINLKKYDNEEKMIYWILFKMMLWCIGYFVFYFVVMMFKTKANKIFAFWTGIGTLLVFLVSILVLIAIVVMKVEAFLITGSSTNDTLPISTMEHNGGRNIFVDEKVIESLSSFRLLPSIFMFLHTFIMHWSIRKKMEWKDDPMLMYVIMLSFFPVYHMAYFIYFINGVMESVHIEHLSAAAAAAASTDQQQP